MELESIRIAVAIQGDPEDRATWSGVPAGISSGFNELGVEVVPISATFPAASRIGRVARMSWADQAANPLFAAACGRSANRAIRSSGKLDGIVMLGTGYSLKSSVPTVTYEDMTLVQARATGDPVYNALTEAQSRRWQERQRRAYERNRGCCVASNWAGTSIRDDYGIEDSKIHAIGFGRNFEPLPRNEERTWDAPSFIFIGGDWRRKRGDAVVAAFKKVRERHPNASLELVGGHPPVNVPGIIGHGRLAMNTREGRGRYVELLAGASCLVLPSEFEPFGIAYLDAAAAGVPSIGTTRGGAPEAIGPGGIVVDPGDEDALASAMLKLAEPEAARKFGEAAIERSRLFTWRAVAERLMRALQPAGLDVSSLEAFLDAETAEEKS